jgi:hypothetical protein
VTWRARGIAAAAIVLALVGSFGAGRYSRPAKVTERAEAHATKDTAISDKLAIATAEVISLKRDLATWQARAASAESHTDVVTKWRYLPGKIVEVTQESRSDAKSEEHSTGGSKATTASTKDLKASKLSDHEEATHETVVTLHTREVEDRPSWSVSLMPGYQIAGSKAVEINEQIVIGASVDRRVVGGVFVGAWGSTSGAVGVSIRGEL